MVLENAGAVSPRWELAAETIAVKIRWFGLVVGYLLVNLDDSVPPERCAVLNALLALGAVYTLFDTYASYRGRVFLGRFPLLISVMEAFFIGVLCYFHAGLDSPFRYYYFLSLICCAIRYSSQVTYTTWLLHAASCTGLYLAALPDERQLLALLLTLVILGWVTWASDSLALLLKRFGAYLGRLNDALRENQAQLEARIAERTRQLQEAQAHLLHQEKMAAFGLLAAGIAHEVGNPLTAISSLVQILQRRQPDPYTADKLALVSGQLARIQTTLRELVNFSRPASTERGRVCVADVVAEALGIAKYYQRTKGRAIHADVPADLPAVIGVRDQLVQVLLNLVLNAVDATARGGRVDIVARSVAGAVELTVADDGPGVAPEHVARLFQAYFTTKKNGTGLGLFVSRKLASDQGGGLDYEPRPGGGALFRLRLPADSPSTSPEYRLNGPEEPDSCPHGPSLTSSSSMTSR